MDTTPQDIATVAHRLGCNDSKDHDVSRHVEMATQYYDFFSRYPINPSAEQIIKAIIDVSHYSKGNRKWTHPHPAIVLRWMEENMGVKFTQESEIERVNTREIPSWGLMSSTSLVQALHFARNNGWKDKTVQVRTETIGVDLTYFVEPFERDCSCPNILKYSDYFD